MVISIRPFPKPCCHCLITQKDLYVTPPGKLEDEWVYKQHPEDWQKYHTRYVTPQVFQNSLRSQLPK